MSGGRAQANTVPTTHRFRHGALLALVAAGIAAALLAPPIPQDPHYHDFADARRLLGIPAGLNVLSNLLFLWAGGAGLHALFVARTLAIVNRIRPAYAGFFAALVLVAAGSTVYHVAPANATLAWDRLAMTLGFMSFTTILLAERVSLDLARRLFPWLLAAGVASIVYWRLGDTGGGGDLRAYALVQFLPLALAPLILWLYPSRFTRRHELWWVLVLYGLAKAFELLDHEIYAALGVVSGHSLKHLAAGVACILVLRHLRRRSPLET